VLVSKPRALSARGTACVETCELETPAADERSLRGIFGRANYCQSVSNDRRKNVH